jgi:chromatin segregation and condensation protein Rec8/ScpA/Scc1 (kleisin family)
MSQVHLTLHVWAVMAVKALLKPASQDDGTCYLVMHYVVTAFMCFLVFTQVLEVEQGGGFSEVKLHRLSTDVLSTTGVCCKYFRGAWL